MREKRRQRERPEVDKGGRKEVEVMVSRTADQAPASQPLTHSAPSSSSFSSFSVEALSVSLFDVSSVSLVVSPSPEEEEDKEEEKDT